MTVRKLRMSFLLWISSDTHRNKGGAHTMKGSSGSGMMQPTSEGVRLGCAANAVTRK
jgi:hypothetical protein